MHKPYASMVCAIWQGTWEYDYSTKAFSNDWYGKDAGPLKLLMSWKLQKQHLIQYSFTGFKGNVATAGGQLTLHSCVENKPIST